MAELVTRHDLEVALRHVEQRIEQQTLRLTVRLGGLIVLEIASLGVLQRLV